MAPRKQTVGKICASLGYPSDDNKDERYLRKLSNPMRDFCKSFQEGLSRPVDFTSPKGNDTLDCAADFAAKNQHLFPDSKIARERHWPIYSYNRDRIRNGLARLIYCQTQYKKKKNLHYENPKMAKNADNPSLPERASAPTQVTTLPSPISKPSTSRINALPMRAERVVSGLASPLKESTLHIEDTIRHEAFEHLDFIYPSVKPVKSQSSCWLLGFGAECPQDIKAHALRYLHDNDLYDPGNKAAIRIMVNHMKTEFNVGESGMNDEMIFTKCEDIISDAVREWRDDDLWDGYGFLTHSKENSNDHAWIKTAVFESVWRTRRALWLAKNETTGSNVEKDSPATSSTGDIPRSPKRVAQSLDDESDVDLFDGWGSIYRKSKRRKSDGARSIVSPPPPNISRKDDAFHSINSSIPDQAPPARMYTPRNSTPATPSQSSVRSMSTELAIRSSPAKPRSLGKETPPAVYPNSSSRQQKPKVTQAAPSGLGLKRITLNKMPTSGSVLAPQDRTTALPVKNPATSDGAAPNGLGLKRIPSNKIPASVYTSSPKTQNAALPANNAVVSEVSNRRPLWFALPGPTGDPETSPNKLVSIKTFKDSSRSDFFKLVAARAGLTLAELAFVRFRCAWGGRKATVVNRFTTEEQWAEIKETEILERYRMAQVELPKQEKFHVWIFCNNTSE